jgi:predicted phage terminase large subunit-like protein
VSDEDDKVAAQRGAALSKQIMAAQRMKRLLRAKNSLIDFTCMSMPSPDDPDDPEKSRYDPQLHHRALADALERVEKGEILRLIVTMPPRHGKSELISKRFPAWVVGRDPYRHVIVAGYGDEFAQEFGKEVREIIQSPFYKQVFPGTELRRGSKAANRLQTTEGGIMTFAGVGGALTGRGGDVICCDDFLKNAEEANSHTHREKQWQWFTQVLMTRGMSSGASVIITATRWHEDDLIGRLTDIKNPCYREEVAKHWKVLHLPMIAEDDDPLGRKVGECLWPQRHSYDFAMQQRALDPRGFSALYQGRPTPPDGDFFKRKWITENSYRPDDLPKHLRWYAASDHAVSEAQTADRNCFIKGGVDATGVLWIHPLIWWKRAGSEEAVDGMLEMMRHDTPLIWWAEKGHISKAIGPFLHKRMLEENVHVNVEEVSAAKDKMTRAQSIQGRMSMGMVRFPTFAPWWAEFEDELLKFPAGRFDDAVDAISHLGGGLRRMTGVAPRKPVIQPKSGTWGWIKAMGKATKEREKALKVTAGW